MSNLVPSISTVGSIAVAWVLMMALSPTRAGAMTDQSLSSADQWVTISLVPDGTLVANTPSSLFASVGQKVGGDASLATQIARAAQRWAVPTNLNFSFVSDQGQPLGANGLSHHDPRFGDIRVAAIPLPMDIRGRAFSKESLVAGTWRGDIILNSNYPFSAQTLLQVVIHELGHSLGFEHIEGIPSVLNPSNDRTSLSEIDILLLQDRFGVRDLDPYDGVANNDTLRRATKLRLRSSEKGALPVIAFGDLSSPRDIDFFSVNPDKKFTGNVTFQLRSRGNSLVSASLQILNRSGVVIGQSQVHRTGSGMAQVSLPVRNLTDTCYVRIRSIAGEFEVGSYALVAFYNRRLNVDRQLFEETATWQFSHLSQNHVRYRLRDGAGEFFFADDLNTNDSLLAATQLDPIEQVAASNLHRVDASISNELDLDFYRFDISQDVEWQPVTIQVLSRDAGLLIPYLDVMTADGIAIPRRIISNGNGLQIVQLDGLPAGSYVVAVSAGIYSAAPFTTGNYSLEIRSDRPAIMLQNYSSGWVTEDESQFHSLRVARSQMFHFGLSAFSATGAANSVVDVTIFDEEGNPVYHVATRPGELRTSQSVVLSPGSYVLRVDYASLAAVGSLAEVSYQFSGIADTDNEGPTLIDPTLSPFPKCDPTRDVYCYPDGPSIDPFIWVDGLSPDLIPPLDPPRPWDNVDRWYWPSTSIA